MDPFLSYIEQISRQAGTPTHLGIPPEAIGRELMGGRPFSFYEHLSAIASLLGNALPFRGGIGNVRGAYTLPISPWRRVFRGEGPAVPPAGLDTMSGRWFSPLQEYAAAHRWGTETKPGRMLELTLPEHSVQAFRGVDPHEVLLPAIVARTAQKMK